LRLFFPTESYVTLFTMDKNCFFRLNLNPYLGPPACNRLTFHQTCWIFFIQFTFHVPPRYEGFSGPFPGIFSAPNPLAYRLPLYNSFWMRGWFFFHAPALDRRKLLRTLLSRVAFPFLFPSCSPPDGIFALEDVYISLCLVPFFFKPARRTSNPFCSGFLLHPLSPLKLLPRVPRG